jgi:hypothetical protein
MVERTLRSGALDRVAILLSGLCLVHCVASAVAVAVLATAGGMLFDPLIHEVGLALAILLGLVALGWGYREHGRVLPVMVGAMGVALMSAALSMGHVPMEIPLTILGVSLLAAGHVLNRRAVV